MAVLVPEKVPDVRSRSSRCSLVGQKNYATDLGLLDGSYSQIMSWTLWSGDMV